MPLLRWVVRVHKWLALIVGIQIVLWVLGGFMMSVLDIDRVHGDHNVAPVTRAPVEMIDILPPAEAAQRAGLANIFATRLETWQARPVYRFEMMSGRMALVAALTGELLSPIDEATARQIALADHIATPDILSAEFFMDPPREYGRAGPVWQITFDDGEGTRTYVSPETGEVVTHRNDTWRLFDFFWMLHIMDYEERDDFNHPLLVSFAALSLITVFAGLVLLVLKMQRFFLSQMKRLD
jgi:uncharacterized iron-regulated membrane protein